MAKQVRTIKDLQNHPFVDCVDKEYNPGVFDGYDYTYWVYLKEGLWFECEEIGLLHEATIKALCDRFNSMKITKRTDGF